MEWTITVNGAERAVPSRCTVSHLLQILEADPTRVAVECNQAVVPRRSYDTTELADGDRVEIVTFVGGG
jgi:thiamine biosynthesis protein ThiS